MAFGNDYLLDLIFRGGVADGMQVSDHGGAQVIVRMTQRNY